MELNSILEKLTTSQLIIIIVLLNIFLSLLFTSFFILYSNKKKNNISNNDEKNNIQSYGKLSEQKVNSNTYLNNSHLINLNDNNNENITKIVSQKKVEDDDFDISLEDLPEKLD